MSRVFKGRLKGVLGESFQCISKEFERSSKGIPEKFQRRFKDVSRIKDVSRKFQECSKED